MLLSLAAVRSTGFNCGDYVFLHRTQDGETALQLAIKHQLPLVVDAICTRGADMSVPDEKGNPPLWLALASNLEDIASTLVSHAKQSLCLQMRVCCVKYGLVACVALQKQKVSQATNPSQGQAVENYVMKEVQDYRA